MTIYDPGIISVNPKEVPLPVNFDETSGVLRPRPGATLSGAAFETLFLIHHCRLSVPLLAPIYRSFGNTIALLLSMWALRVIR
jgi:hypothetical protein